MPYCDALVTATTIRMNDDDDDDGKHYTAAGAAGAAAQQAMIDIRTIAADVLSE